MTKKITFLDTIKYLIFFSIGFGIFIWVYRNQNFNSLYSGISDFQYGWIIASFCVGLLSHFFRALRWRMLIESIGYRPRIMNTFLSILIMYLANYALPRMGEVTRCGILKKYEGIPFTSQLGTVIIERIVDFLFLLLLLISVVIIEWDILAPTLIHTENCVESKNFLSLGNYYMVGIAVALLTLSVLGLFFRNQLMRTKLSDKFRSYLIKFSEGLKSVLHLQNPWLFVLLTICIYGCYYLLTLTVMLAFPPTAKLSPIVALVVVVFGSVGMVLPVQGGIGTFHALAAYALVLYGITQNDSILLALVLHGATALFMIFIGTLALIILPILNRKKNII